MENNIKKIEVKGRKEVVFRISYKELNRIITEFYELETPYECVAEEEWSNDSEHSFDIYGDIEKYGGYDKLNALQLLRDGKVEQWSTNAYLQYMAHVGAIEPAKYLVTVSW